MFAKTFRVVCGRNTARKYSSIITDVREFAEVPSPKGLPFFGTTLSLIVAGGAPKLHEYVDKRHRQLGHIYREKIGPVSAVFLSNPEDMRTVFAQEGKYPMHVLPEAWVLYNQMFECSRGLFFMDGEEWWHFRRIMNKHLLKGDKKYIESACEVVSDMTLQIIEQTARKNVVYPNLEQELYLWSIQVLVATLLGREAYRDSYMRTRLLMQMLANKVHLIFQATSKLSLIPANLAARWNIPQWKTFVSCVDGVLKISNTLVSILLDRCPEGDGLLKRLKDDHVNRVDLTRIVSDLVLAAGDTTAYTMEWMLYNLALYPKVQQVLRNEKQERELLLNYVLKETLRLYPVAPFLTRILPEDCILGGYRIPKKTLLVMSIYTSGRDGRHFDNPEEFRLDRWIRTEPGATVRRGQMKHASLPFAMGVRSCVGRRIAERQLQMTLSKIVDSFRITLCNKRDVDAVLKMVMVPSVPLQLKFEKLK